MESSMMMGAARPRLERTGPHRVFVVDRHEPCAREVAAAMRAADNGLEMSGYAHSFDEAYTELVRSVPDAVLLDAHGEETAEVVARIKRYAPDVAILVVGGGNEPETVMTLLSAGSDGVLPQSASADDIAVALHAVVHGEPALDPGISPAVASLAVRAAKVAASDERMLQRLTPRERQALDLLSQGATNREIAKGLEITRRGVERHLANAYVKLGVHNRIEAARTYGRLLVKADGA